MMFILMTCKDTFDCARLNTMSLKFKKNKEKIFWVYEQSYLVITEKLKGTLPRTL